MPNYLHRTTKQELISISPNSLPELEANYIRSPDLSAVSGQPARYWIITGDVVTLADQAARDIIDADIITTDNNNLAENLDRVLKAVVLALNDGSFIPNSNYTNLQLKTIIKGKL